MQSLFIISLDFELMWGVRDKRTIETYGANVRGVRQVIPSLLELFERYDIAATFATVGFLFARSKSHLLSYLPEELPDYPQKRYSPYDNDYFHVIGSSEADDIYHYGASLIELIKQSPKQEIATHTFSHYYCLEGASLTSFEADLVSAKKIAADQGVVIKSIVFPRNQYSPAHLDIAARQGIIAYRGNEPTDIYKPRSDGEQSNWIRAARLADSYLNIDGHHSFSVNERGRMVNIPASRFLRPFSPALKGFEGLRLRRIKNSMTFSAEHGEAFHLWWHPHNFGINLKENLLFLEEILKHYTWLNQMYGMQNKTMSTVAEEALKSHAF